MYGGFELVELGFAVALFGFVPPELSVAKANEVDQFAGAQESTKELMNEVQELKAQSMHIQENVRSEVAQLRSELQSGFRTLHQSLKEGQAAVVAKPQSESPSQIAELSN